MKTKLKASRHIERYKSLIGNMVTVSRGTFTSNTFIQLQVRPANNGHFFIDYTDGYKFLSATKVMKLNDTKRTIRSFIALKLAA